VKKVSEFSFEIQAFVTANTQEVLFVFLGGRIGRSVRFSRWAGAANIRYP